MSFWHHSGTDQQHTATIPICQLADEISVLDSTEQIPTFYVHGFRGGDHTTEKMVGSAQQFTDSPVFLRATVDWHGKIHYSGYWSTALHPIIQLVFKDRWIASNTIERWFNQILNDLNQRYHFQSYNAVGHSLGSVALISFLIHSYNRPLPQINRLALIAGPFNGVVFFGDLPNINPLSPKGRPAFMTPKYLWTYLNRFKFPKQAHVLNIFGNIEDSSNTDQYVSVSSARSIKYILQNQVQDFQEYNAIGFSGEHSQMHDDANVLRKLNNFIYAELK
ncbi:alpha/beta hydrolase [Bombilactobacillus thymidiniphilus]|uniref:Alpha/beta hydrolase n=1 Tax=Bombilactobacillus thymidiniphilus TaxID=2923363 RepID=A0ABY4PEJ3_9LACO|nr:alpha/beta hydrolase [Bombilactobacillus thymidiniphilus]UQS84161.1 alpha/beta hydrolase [Bombilactobacillus thymidiniphilus]